MATITISSLDDGRWTRLHDHASRNGRCVEEDARPFICMVVGHTSRLRNAASVVLSRIRPTDAPDLALPGVSCRPSRERSSMEVLPDSMPAPDRPGVYPLPLRRIGIRTILAMRPAGPGAITACVPGPGRPFGRDEP